MLFKQCNFHRFICCSIWFFDKAITCTWRRNIFIVVVHTYSLSPNAQLRGEQRYPPNLKHCTVTTNVEVEAKVPSVGNPS
ncbi:hypothetical protein C1M56_20600 [Vibrio diazotrophicus]|nr:hypothetical protein C1M56_20600 [Vibrio diazotrophicus]